MQLEKATSTNSEAGLAGWISSNDVTLFTMVLVVIVALFLHGKLIRGQDENKVLVDTNESLAESLDLTESQRNELNNKLKARGDQLAETQRKLRESQEKLEQEAIAAMKQIGALTTTIDSMSAQNKQLVERRGKLEKDLSSQALKVQDLTEAKDSLAGEKKTLTQRMNDLAKQLEDRVKVLDELKKERQRLQDQTKQLDAIVLTLKQKLSDSGTEITKLAAKAGETEAEYQKRIAALEKVASAEAKRAGDQAKRADDYLAKLKRAADLFQGLKKSNASLEQKLDGAEERYQRQLMLETTVNRKLVGINGKLKKVAILFDASGSMKQKDEEQSGDRWQDAQDIAGTWLGHLDVDECVLIVFSSDVRTFPSDGKMANIQGPQGEANRAQLLEQLKSVEPEGWTNTLDALKKAYTYQGVDTILLFSDGAPTFANSGRFDPNVAEQIYALCREHPDVPINTVGLGNYFDQNLSTFLRTVANISGGTFRGR